MVCPVASVKASVQPVIAAVPVLVIVMLVVSPVFHALTALVIRQAPVAGGFDGGVDGDDGGVEGPLPPRPARMASMMPCWVTVAAARSNRPKPCCPFQPLSQYAVAAPYFL